MNTPVTKVISGVRRAGKSTLILVNLESLEFDAIRDYRRLYEYVRPSLEGLVCRARSSAGRFAEDRFNCSPMATSA
jgi:hypothetical protein